MTSWRTCAIYKVDDSFSNPPEMMYSHSGGPADISYNRRDDILAIPLGGHSIPTRKRVLME